MAQVKETLNIVCDGKVDTVTGKVLAFKNLSFSSLKGFQFRWLKMKRIHVALLILITLSFNHLK